MTPNMKNRNSDIYCHSRNRGTRSSKRTRTRAISFHASAATTMTMISTITMLALASSAHALSFQSDANGNSNFLPSWSQLLPHHTIKYRSIFGLRHRHRQNKLGRDHSLLALDFDGLLRIRGGSSPKVMQPHTSNGSGSDAGSGAGAGAGPYNSTMEDDNSSSSSLDCQVKRLQETQELQPEKLPSSLSSSSYAIETTTHHVDAHTSNTMTSSSSSSSTPPSLEIHTADGTLQVKESPPILSSTAVAVAIPPTVSKSDTTTITTSTNEDEYKKALFKTGLTVASAFLFGIAIMATRGVSSGYEFYAGYLIEQSLSIDNLFVFIMLFDYFNIPMGLQNRVLSWGIWGAILLRGLMIGVGVKALQQFRSVILVFAGILIASSVNLLLEKDHEGSGNNDDDNMIMKVTKFIFPHTTSELHGEAFFIPDPNSVSKRNIATPLFLCLVCVELSDFVFAVDSIPAVLGVSKDPLIVYASNIFAILALRSLYTVVAKAVSSFHYLKPAVAMVLGFVGAKMVAEYFHYEIGTGASLAVICSILGTGIGASVWKNNRDLERNNSATATAKCSGSNWNEDDVGYHRQGQDHGLVVPA